MIFDAERDKRVNVHALLTDFVFNGAKRVHRAKSQTLQSLDQKDVY